MALFFFVVCKKDYIFTVQFNVTPIDDSVGLFSFKSWE